MLEKCAQIWDKVRSEKPLVHCITNYVTVQDVANILLASGASPAMVENPHETEAFAKLAKALYFNLGTLTNEQKEAMLKGARGANEAKVPLIIDPVACGVIPRKIEVLQQLTELGEVTCIRGNTAEIKSLAGMESQAKGVDSLDKGEGMENTCKDLALQKKCIIAATAETDIISDGSRVAKIENGTELFSVITGAGCMVSSLVAACIGVNPDDAYLATITAILAYNIAGERAARKSGFKPGSFRVALFDELYDLRGEDIIKEAKIVRL